MNRRISVVIDGSQAGQGIAPVTEAIEKLESKLQGLDKTSKDYDVQVKKIKTELEKKNKTLETYKAKIAETERVMKNLSGATYKELTAVRDLIRMQLHEAVPGTKKYNDLLMEQKRVSEQLAKVQKDMRTEVGCQATAFGKAANFVNKYAMLLSGALASLTGLTLTIRKTVDDYAKMEEAMADVKKYTGMADEGVKLLNEDLKKMDTRTSRERLNALAADAGRLGITSRDAILEFVDAADKINVALGEDLGEDAVKNIGKLAQMFGEDQKKGLRGAMLATGSAVNELAQNSSASESYIVDFTARLAGVGQQAGISQADIMGFASALDQNMQQLETSSTVLSQLITKMFQQPAKFAALAGMEVKEFSELIARDANAAVLRFLETMQKKGGFDALAPMFEEMKLNGTRAVGVLSTVATHIDQVKDAQALANKAYSEGTSIINEFNVKNNTVQSQLEKAKKGFLEVSIALGEKLLPVSAHMITSGSALVKVLSSLITFSHDYFTTILTTATAYSVYSAAVNKAVLVDKLKVFWNKQVVTSMKSLYALLRNNPWGIAALAVGALIGYLIDLKRKQDAVNEAQKAMNKVNEKAKEEFDEQSFKLYLLTSAVRNNTNRIDDRRKAIEEIKKIVPGYNAMIDEEGRLINENTSALDAYLRNMEKEIKMKAAREELEEQYRKKRQLERQLGKENEDLRQASINLNSARASSLMRTNKASTAGTRNLMGGLDQGVKSMESEFSKAQQAVDKTNAALAETSDAISLLESEIKSSGIGTITSVTEDGVPGGLGSGGSGSDEKAENKARKTRLEKLKAEYTEEQAEIKRIYAQGKDEELQTEKQYNEQLLAAKKYYLQQVKVAAGEGTKEYAEAESELADIQLQERKDALQKAIDDENEIYENQKRQLQQDYITRSDERIDSQEAYNELLEQLELMHLQRMLEIAGLDADSRMKIEQQVRDFQMKCVGEELAARKKASDEEVKDAQEKRKKLEENAKQQRTTLEGYAKSFGDTVGRVISDQEDALKAFSDTMIDIIFDVLEKIIEAEIVKATARAVASQAAATAESFATADSVLTFGATGAARAAVLSALIMGALAAAKATLKGLIGGKGGSSHSAGDAQSSPKVYQRVAQHASGRYQVIGQQDGRLYDAPFIGASPTGIVRSPALIAENGAELIVNAEDLARLQKHMNYPLVLQAIAESRRPQPVAQYASGSYPQDMVRPASSPAGADPVMRRLAEVLEAMVRNGVKAPVVLSEIEKKQQLRDAARMLGSKG